MIFKRMIKDGIVWIDDRAYLEARDIATELQGKCEAQEKEIQRLHALLANRVAVDVSPAPAVKA